MGTWCILFSIAVFAQNGSVAELETFEFRINGEVHYGTVDEQPDGVMLRFKVDAPWMDGVHPLDGWYRRDQVEEYSPESSGHRERRHRAAWEERGFRNAAREGEAPIWVPREEVLMAERAKAMAAPFMTAGQSPPAAPNLDTGTLRLEEAEAGPLQYWPHAALVVVGLLLAGVVTRTLILPG